MARSAHDEVAELLRQVDLTPYGPEEIALVRAAVAVAAESGDPQLEYQTRARLNVSAKMVGDTDTLVSSFSWCLAMHDSDPTTFDLDLHGPSDLMWQYKWMIGAVSSSPIFPRETIDAVLVDMAERYERAGLGQSGVLTARLDEATANGRLDDAEALRLELKRTPRDSHSHCEACTYSDDISLLALTGRDTELVTVLDELVADGFTCSDEPEHAFAVSLLPLVRVGRADDAVRAHRRSYRDSRADPERLLIVAHHIIFVALTGNAARALSMVERHLPWLAHDGLDGLAHRKALEAVAIACTVVTADGYGDTVVSGPESPALASFFPARETPWTAEELAAAAWAAAADIGAAFDARNGNDHYARTLRAAQALADERYDVPLEAARHVPAVDLDPEPETAAGWLVRSRAMLTLSYPDEALAAARRATATATPDELQKALRLICFSLVSTDHHDEALEFHEARLDALRTGGETEQADSEERRGLSLYDVGSEENVRGVVAELDRGPVSPRLVAELELSYVAARLAADRADGADGLDERAELDARIDRAIAHLEMAREVQDVDRAHFFRAQLSLSAGDLDTALTALGAVLDGDRAVEPEPVHAAIALEMRAFVLRGADDPHRASADADRATTIYARLGARIHAAGAAEIAAGARADAEDLAGAVARQRFALDQTTAAGAPTWARGTELARFLLMTGGEDETYEALDLLANARDELASLDEAGATGSSVVADLLGRATAATGDTHAAIGSWLSAAEGYEAAGRLVDAAEMLTLAGTAMLSLDDEHEAAETLTEAVALARRADDGSRTLFDALTELSTAQASMQDEAALVTIDEAIALAQAHDAEPLVAFATYTRARVLAPLGHDDEAARTALAAADLFAAVDDADQAALAEHFAGLAFEEIDRPADAVVAYRAGIERAPLDYGLNVALRLRLADALDATGRPDEASEARRAADELE
ncbi:hypothetical protein [Sanguibacter sp. 25GB23B1]|uniref:hypothetical protein n=1 Tax=unclassified Sanguibacter TaxID=2645534 RepID=UPI0032AF3A6F